LIVALGVNNFGYIKTYSRCSLARFPVPFYLFYRRKEAAVGLGKLGDEDMCGFESLPTLPDRKTRIATEIKNVEEIKEATNKMNFGYIKTYSRCSLARFPVPFYLF
jgi:hypothetical protein